MHIKKNIFFDLDGVLVDACDWHYESLNNALAKNNCPKIQYEDHILKFNGLPTKTKLTLLDIKKEKFETIISSKNEIFNKIVDDKCKADNIKIELMKYLKSKKSRIACITNSIKNTAYTVLKKLEILSFFDLILSNEDVKLNKPDPCPYNTAIELLNSHNCINIAVEDSPKGIESASKSNINIVWKVKNSLEVNLINYKLNFGE